MAVVLDASAVLALLKDEHGADTVERLLKESKVLESGHTGLLSTVNLAEVQQYAPDDAVDELLGPNSPIGVVPFTAGQAKIAADLFAPTRVLGLSLADRSCLGLAIDTKLTVVTAEHSWLELDKQKLGIDVAHIRPAKLQITFDTPALASAIRPLLERAALIAAAAEHHGLAVLHHDSDYDLISAVTGQVVEWVVPAGSAD